MKKIRQNNNGSMKKLVNTISPYLLLLVPVFMALVILITKSDSEQLRQSVEMHAAFFKIPYINLLDVVVGFFKCPSM